MVVMTKVSRPNKLARKLSCTMIFQVNLGVVLASICTKVNKTVNKQTITIPP